MSGRARETEKAGVTTSQTDLGPGKRDAGLVASSVSSEILYKIQYLRGK